jgi:hypothetical protein
MEISIAKNATREIQKLTVECFGKKGYMKFKVYTPQGQLYFTSSKECYDENQCYERATKVVDEYWKVQKRNLRAA